VVKNSFIDWIYNFSQYILRAMYVNFLWLLFSLLGLVITGFFPSTIAMFTVVRKWVLGESRVPIFETFWITYKKQFLGSNLLGYSLSIIGVVIYTDLLFLQHTDNSFLKILYIPVLFLTLLYLLTLLFVFPIFVHYDVKGFQIIKNAFYISIISPLATIKMVLSLVIIGYFMITFPSLSVLFSGSVSSYFIMRIANTAFLKYERKRTKIVNELKEN
jgi:uncharacterized membrane protein YesL